MGTPWVSFDGKDCSGCKYLNDRGYCEFTGCVIPCTVSATIPDVKPQTNVDRIRSMTDEELANFIVHRDCCPGFVADTFSDANRKKYGFDGRSERCEYGDECHECWLDWLRQEAEEWT